VPEEALLVDTCMVVLPQAKVYLKALHKAAPPVNGAASSAAEMKHV